MTSLMTWFVPAAGPVRDLLAATIGRLAAEHGAPAFPPHVTMAGMFDADEDAAASTLAGLLTGVRPFPVTFPSVGHEPTYFRSLYLRAEPSPQLTSLHQAARLAWAPDLPPYQPHLSLLYSDFSEQRKRAIIAAIDLPLPLTIAMDAVELWADDQRGTQGWRRCCRVRLAGAVADQEPPGR